MRIQRVVLAVSLLAVAATLARSEESRQYPVYGAGMETCGTYLDKRQRFDRGGFEGPYAQAVTSWVMGFVSGQNALAPAAAQHNESIPSTSVLAYLDKFCRDHPLGVIVAGTNCFLGEVNGGKPLPACR